MLVLYPLEPHPKDCVDTPEGNLESGAVVPRQMEESTAPTDQRCFDRATSQHVYTPWSLIHEIFCQTRRLRRSSCDALVAGSWSASPRTPASAGCPFPRLSRRGAAAPSATEPSQLRGPLHGGRDQPLKIWLPKCWNQKIQCTSGDVEHGETVVPFVER